MKWRLRFPCSRINPNHFSEISLHISILGVIGPRSDESHQLVVVRRAVIFRVLEPLTVLRVDLNSAAMPASLWL